MEKIINNPSNYQEQYIENLNKCFNGWGGVKEYNWGLNRKIGQHETDIMLIENDEDGVIAGSAVSYRTLAGNNQTIEIGIMTGSWTLPAARRKGCFSKMIENSNQLCKEKNVPFLTAFVTEENASRRRLESAGSYMFPTFHLFSPEEPYNIDENNIESLENNENVRKQIYERTIKTQKNFLSFSYTLEEFSSQYINRIKETILLKIGDDFAIVEGGVNEMKILLLTSKDPSAFNINIQAITNWCLREKGKKSFFFTTRKELADICLEKGFNCGPGFFTILKNSDESIDYKVLFNSLDINMADKM
ncbi:GNAT family N-acetyltransferase [Autumnicola musiva]|uniref:GNAT family N-acetyltransferase n=1 Tax=Autumnicola musiva TaxID=3075589 RepID=A0ABU3D7F7_9FLAO|nr:GNAT family N-acetyltransferase [Zunongwangia sp. F117]MDT0677472.1 GNAT family N-acetyltransferase [Zunongwangia sp. F117]